MKPKSVWPEYLLTYGLIAISGVEYFCRAPAYALGLFLGAVAVTVARRVPLTLKPLRIVLVVFVLELVQALHFDNFVPMSLLTVVVRLLTVYLIIHICGLRFVRHFATIIGASALISLPIYAATFVPPIEQFLIQDVALAYFRPLFDGTAGIYGVNPNIIIYTFNLHAEDMIGTVLMKRNSGPFWEPGGFAVYLNIALVFNLMNHKRLFDRPNSLLIGTILTTFSTAGYLTLFLVVIGYLLTNQAIRPAVKLLWLLVLIPAAGVLYTQTAFLSGKVDQNISLTREDNTSRFGSAYLDLIDIAKSPLIGFGRLNENRFGQQARSLDTAVHRNNGVTFMAVTYGIPYALAYFLYVFVFFRRYCRAGGYPVSFALVGFAALISCGFSQVIFERAVPITFLFLAERLGQLSHQRNQVTHSSNALTIPELC